MEQLLTKKEVAQLLGVSVKTIDSWVCKRIIPFIPITPGCVRFLRSDLEAWVKAKAIFPTDTSEVPYRTYAPIRVRKLAHDTNVDRMVKRAKEEVLHGNR
jgi:excisionase family DNA binding protein